MTYDTLVVEGMNEIPRSFNGMRVAAWSKGNALQERDRMERLLEDIRDGVLEDPSSAAERLLEEIQGQ